MSSNDSYDYDDDVHTLLTHKTANEHARRYRSGEYEPAEYVQDEDGSGNIIRFAINDMTDEDAAKMSSDEQCNIIINSMMGDFDGSARLFKNALSSIINAVDYRIQRSSMSGMPISKDQMDRYEAEFDTWLSYTVDIFKSCQDILAQRILDVMFLADHCVTSKWGHAVEEIICALAELYNDDVWNRFVSDYLEFGLPEGYTSDFMDFMRGIDTISDKVSHPDRIYLYIIILKRAGSELRQICKRYWMTDDRICAQYLKYLLQRGDRPAARRVASVGLEMFPKSSMLAVVALCAFDPKSPDMVRARCFMYANSLDSEYYKTVRESEHWNEQWARRLADVLAINKEYDAEILVLTDAGMYDPALDVLLYDGTIKMAISHHKKFAATHPDRYYEICRDLVVRAPKKGMDTTHYAMIRHCLCILRDIPGHESDFYQLCNSLLQQDARSVAAPLRKSIKDIVASSEVTRL